MFQGTNNQTLVGIVTLTSMSTKDEIALLEYGKEYRDLTKAQQAKIDKLVGDFESDPENGWYQEEWDD